MVYDTARGRVVLFGGQGETTVLGDTWVLGSCDSDPVWYRDLDGDGWGNLADSLPSCAAPIGYVPTGGDCDDTDSTTYQNAPEVNDGRDNQCPGGDGYGVIDEISGTFGFSTPADESTLCCVPQAGAMSYQLVRSGHPDFDAACVVSTQTVTCFEDAFIPSIGQVFYYSFVP
jgi:hypothetical protein